MEVNFMFFIMTLLRPGYSENFPFRNLGIYYCIYYSFQDFQKLFIFDCWGKIPFLEQNLVEARC